MPGPLVRIGSYLTVWEADWQRSRLAEAGILSCTDNCALVLWFWQYSQAVGGVKLFVDGARLNDAAALLSHDMPRSPTSSEPPPAVWSCPHCSAELAPDWDICWRCAPAPDPNDGSEAAAFPEIDTDDEHSRVVVAAVAALLLTWAVISHGPVVGAGLLALTVVAWILFGRLVAGTEPPEDVDPDAPSPDPPRRTSLAEAISLRAWRSAIMGLLWFPPLLFYALYLLVRLGWGRFELSPLARAHRWGAIVSLLAALSIVGMILVSLSSDEIFYLIDWARMYFRRT